MYFDLPFVSNLFPTKLIEYIHILDPAKPHELFCVLNTAKQAVFRANNPKPFGD